MPEDAAPEDNPRLYTSDRTTNVQRSAGTSRFMAELYGGR
jgi:hypothetical protein